MIIENEGILPSIRSTLSRTFTLLKKAYERPNRNKHGEI